MTKDAYYFSHDSNARNDEKIVSLRMSHGWEGYGIYWALVEMLRDSATYELEMDYKRIAFALHADCGVIESVITSYDLFAIDAGLFWSISLKIRMEKKDIKSKKAKAAADKRWSNVRKECDINANALPVQSAPNASKVKEKKVNKNKEEDLKTFEVFRKSYPGSKLGNETEFERLRKHKDWKEVLPDLSALLRCQVNERQSLIQGGQFVPNWKGLSVWINQRCWEQEQAVPENQPSKSTFRKFE